MSTYDFDTEFEPVYEVERDFGKPGLESIRAGVRVDVQTGEMRFRSRAPIFLRVDGDHRPSFRCTSAQAREIASALLAAADLTDGHAP
jgi:hypothetical protein